MELVGPRWRTQNVKCAVVVKYCTPIGWCAIKPFLLVSRGTQWDKMADTLATIGTRLGIAYYDYMYIENDYL